MNAFRVRLTVALGLPLIASVGACKSAPAPEPVTDIVPPGTGTGSAAGSAAVAAGALSAAGLCPADQVHERVCGTVYDNGSFDKVGAEAPFQACPVKVANLVDFEENSIIDGWRVDEQDPSLGNFRWDLAHSKSYTVNNGVREGEPRCCYERCTPLPAIENPRQVGALPAGLHEYQECWPEVDVASHPAKGSPKCPMGLRVKLWYPEGRQDDPLDNAPFLRDTGDGFCCYSVATTHRCPPNTFEAPNGQCEQPNPGGRPLREGGSIVVAPTRAGAEWCAPITETGVALSAAARAAAAERWAREAAYEHASVAAFARLALDLLMHAAPPELVDAAHVAARDEIRHARLCYGIASMFAGRAVGPGPLALGSTTRALTLEDLAVECFRDGCVNETVAALAVAEAARRAEGEELRQTLTAIALDEATHAELSYRILAWTLAVGGEAVRGRITEELAALGGGGAEADEVEAGAEADERTGLLRATTARAIRRQVLADVVLPCTTALLAARLDRDGSVDQLHELPALPRA